MKGSGITSNELRVGNWVSHMDCKWSYRNPESDSGFNFIWSDGDFYALGEFTLFLNDIAPITPTKKWLYEFGFKEYVDGNGSVSYRKSGSSIHFQCEDDNWDEPCIDVFVHGFYITYVEYVHEIQNIYYAIEKHELIRNVKND